jgi:hypothetical protein
MKIEQTYIIECSFIYRIRKLLSITEVMNNVSINYVISGFIFKSIYCRISGIEENVNKAIVFLDEQNT